MRSSNIFWINCVIWREKLVFQVYFKHLKIFLYFLVNFAFFLSGENMHGTPAKNLMIFQYFPISFKAHYNGKNREKLPFLETSEFSRTFLGLKIKYYNLQIFLCRKHAWSRTFGKSNGFSIFCQMMSTPQKIHKNDLHLFLFKCFSIFWSIFWADDRILYFEYLRVFKHFPKNVQGPTDEQKWLKIDSF